MGHGRGGTRYECKGSVWLCQSVLMNYYSLLYLTGYFAQTKDIGIFPPRSQQERRDNILDQSNSGQTAAKSKLAKNICHMVQIYRLGPGLVVSRHPLCLWHSFTLAFHPGHSIFSVFSKPWKLPPSLLCGGNMR